MSPISTLYPLLAAPIIPQVFITLLFISMGYANKYIRVPLKKNNLITSFFPFTMKPVL